MSEERELFQAKTYHSEIIRMGAGEVNLQHDNIKITAYGPGKTVIELDNDEGTFVDIEGTNEVPEIFTQEQFDYLSTLTGHTILRDLKGELLNIIEGCGLPEKQERAIKRSVTSALHEWHHGFREDIELVLIKDGPENGTEDDIENDTEDGAGYSIGDSAGNIDAKILGAAIAPVKIKSITLE